MLSLPEPEHPKREHGSGSRFKKVNSSTDSEINSTLWIINLRSFSQQIVFDISFLKSLPIYRGQ